MTDEAFPTIDLPDEAATLDFGRRLAVLTQPPLCIHLMGDLGAGKTTLSRGLLRGLGHEGSVKSPTYTLVEPYTIAGLQVFHFDLYRLADPEELAYIGIEDYFAAQALILVEWPDRGGTHLPQPDLSCYLAVCDEGRRLRLEPGSDKGMALCRHFPHERLATLEN